MRTLQSSLFICLLMLVGLATKAQANQDFVDYIERYADLAIQEMERAGVPASIKLAQGILESDAGRSFLARRANNHFGIKCGSEWKGKEVYREDDDYDDRGRLIKSCFRSYRTVEASYIAHSEFLLDPRKTFRYGFLFRLDPKNYKAWARGLKKAGYATSATYPQKLISLIERYELYKYDNMSVIDVETPTEIVTSDILRNNDVQYTVSVSTETVEELARRTDRAVRNLIKYNENLKEGSQKLDEGTRVYLQPKRSSFRGRKTYHEVDPGETMFDISQQYGIRLDKLYERNRMTSPQQPATKERIKIRGGKVRSTPKLRSADDPLPTPVETKEEEKPVIDTDPVTDELEMEEEIFDEPIEEEKPAPPVVITPGPKPAPTTPTFPNDEVPVIIVGGAGKKDTTTEQPQPPTTTNTPIPSRNDSQTDTDEELEEDIFGDDQTNTPSNPVPTTTTRPNTPTISQTHTVVKGDTLYNIARRYNTDVATIQRLNNIVGTNINIGQKLIVK